MKTSFIKWLGLAGCFLLMLSATYRIHSTGAPIGSTGAPGEATCAKAGCHTGNNNLNTGNGILDIQLEGLNGTYEPGKTYPVVITLTQPGIRRFGFAATVLYKTGKQAGLLTVTDALNTQLFAGSHAFAGRDYITYKAMGTNPYAADTGRWTFNWTAPSECGLPVVFYTASVAANDDGTDQHDEVYTAVLTLGEQAKQQGREAQR